MLRPTKVEHNFEEPKRSLINELLTSASVGYVLGRTVEWDDWFVHKSLVRPSEFERASGLRRALGGLLPLWRDQAEDAHPADQGVHGNVQKCDCADAGILGLAGRFCDLGY